MTTGFDPKQELALLWQLVEQSGDMMLVMDTDSRFIFANQITARLFGYQNTSQMLSFNAYAIRSPAAQSAEQFMTQDQQVIQQQKPINLLDIHTYAYDLQKIFLTRKSPLYDQDNRLIGVLCHCREISPSMFQKFSMSIASADQYFYKKTKEVERSYQIVNIDDILSKREIECLFFLLRGKTATQIADILFLSKRTVENHLANIKSKLGCNKKSDLIELGMIHGYLNIIPDSLLKKDLSLVLE